MFFISYHQLQLHLQIPARPLRAAFVNCFKFMSLLACGHSSGSVTCFCWLSCHTDMSDTLHLLFRSYSIGRKKSMPLSSKPTAPWLEVSLTFSIRFSSFLQTRSTLKTTIYFRGKVTPRGIRTQDLSDSIPYLNLGYQCLSPLALSHHGRILTWNLNYDSKSQMKRFPDEKLRKNQTVLWSFPGNTPLI